MSLPTTFITIRAYIQANDRETFQPYTNQGLTKLLNDCNSLHNIAYILFTFLKLFCVFLCSGLMPEIKMDWIGLDWIAHIHVGPICVR